MIISRLQIKKINLILSDIFCYELLTEIESDESIDIKTNCTIDEIKEIVNDALGAGIQQESLMYQYCVIVITNRQLFQKPFSPWLKNVLYSDSDAIDKIIDLEQLIQIKNAK